jgi:hypothetical protein
VPGLAASLGLPGRLHGGWYTTVTAAPAPPPQLHTSFPQLPILGLVDWNPSGVSILATYKLGNRRMGLEAAEYAVPRLAWLGVLADMLLVGGRWGEGKEPGLARCWARRLLTWPLLLPASERRPLPAFPPSQPQLAAAPAGRGRLVLQAAQLAR